MHEKYQYNRLDATGTFPGVGVGGVGGFPPVGVGVVGGMSHGSGARPATCRYWCKTPEVKVNVNQAEKPAIASQVVKPGLCPPPPPPPIRPDCPLLQFGGPPQTCSKDGDCDSVDKCCFDRCLGEHVKICKPPYSHSHVQILEKKTFEFAFANIRNKHSVVFFTPEVHKVINSMSPYPYSIML